MTSPHPCGARCKNAPGIFGLGTSHSETDAIWRPFCFIKLITDIAVKNASLSEKPTRISDGKGLYLPGHPNVSKYWQAAYHNDGKQKLFSTGTYTSVSLSEAHTKLIQSS
ncbi:MULTISPECIES: Arm DNA-binding domain-containing protein [Pantoea]|uniref:Arm DNA-binding domain-containing protein n=1 Tax=Pantoea TaxID=53335 RepID=UPI001F4093DF|nr:MULTISPECIES: Arm DNA-binding domain-containing protein [Pantoea]UIL52137.1 Arm DNA-binding domain-containing protein [Pantoea agglomerans]